MKLSKILSIVIAITLFSLLYVYQQTEIFRLAYVGQKNLCLFQDLLDKNTILRYNLERNASLVQLGNKLPKTADLKMPDTYRLVRLASVRENSKPTRPANKQNLVLRFFSVKRQAEAKTIAP